MSPALRARLLQPPVVIGAALVVAIVSIAYAFVSTNPNLSGSYVHPVQGPITQEVDAPGNVKAAESTDLSFQRSGSITYAGPVAGTHVARGTLLASIDPSDAQAALEQAQAALAVQQAKLAALQAGTRPESIAVAQTAVSGAQSTVAQNEQNVISAIQSAYATTYDSVHNKADQALNNPLSSSPTLVVSLSDSQLQASIPADRVAVGAWLSSLQGVQAALSADSTADSVTAAATQAQSGLQKVSAYLAEVANGLSTAVPSSSYNAAAIAGLQSTVALARTNLNAAIAGLNTAQTALTASEAALANAQSSLALAQAPATAQDTAQQVAAVAAAQANLDAAQVALSQTSLYAPFSGTVTNNNANLGATASPGAPLISMISDAQFQFETYVPETDVSKIAMGDAAQVSLDAYKNDAPLSARVVAVDPAATVQNGISSYKVTLEFDQRDPRVQAGLSGNVSITTSSATDVLTVPSSAIITKGTSTFVLVKGTGDDVLTPVTIGISSASGTTQVLSGITASNLIRAFGSSQ